MGKYDPLRDYLKSMTANRVELTFADVGRIIGVGLPASSHGNDTVAWSNSYSHVKGAAWLDAGWVAGPVDMQNKTVVFRRATPEELVKYKSKAPGPASSAALVVRAGPSGVLAHEFWARGLVAVGWAKLEDLSDVHDGARLREMIDEAYGFSPGRAPNTYYELEDFVFGLAPGVQVVTPDSPAREYLLGTVESGYEYDADSDLRGTDEPYRHIVRVDWVARAPRDALADTSRARLDRRGPTVFPIDDTALADLWNAANAGDKTRRFWVEKTLIANRPDRSRDAEHGLGHALWPPKVDKRGADIYAAMREARPGDVVLHLIDNSAFAGVSIVAGPAEDFMGPKGTEWDSRDGWRIPLRAYTELTPHLPREEFLKADNAAVLTAALDTGSRLFYNRDLNLNQGAYLTELPRNLAELLDSTYLINHGHHLPHVGVSTPPPDTQPGPTAEFSLDALAQDTLWAEEDLRALIEAFDNVKQVVLAGPPGTGKTYVAQRVAEFLTGRAERVRTVQFHPSYGYEEFIEGLRPVAHGGAIDFRVMPGKVLQVAELMRRSKAEGQEPGHWVILVDEMNRANLPRVFGELMYLFEYRDTPIDLQYTPGFSLPADLLFIGTMNTADRSIRSIDIALRRRFEVFECFPDSQVLERFYSTKGKTSVPGLVAGFFRLNERLAELLDRHHTIGQTFFMAREFDADRLRQVWARQIGPLIEEYFFDQPDVAAEFTLEEFWNLEE